VSSTYCTNPSFGTAQYSNEFSINRGKIELRNQKPKYQITAPTGKLAEIDDVILKVHYNIQPWVGILTWTQQIDFWNWKVVEGGASKVFKLPALKKKDEKKDEKKTAKKAA
jgi:signal peptidase complex subunit 3